MHGRYEEVRDCERRVDTKGSPGGMEATEKMWKGEIQGGGLW